MSIIHEYFNDDNTGFKWVVKLNNNICGKRIFINNMPSDYIITKDGDVYHTLNNKKLSQKISNKGYLYVYIPSSTLSCGSSFFIHRLVALAYVVNIDNKPIINHIDGCKLNNSIDNLEWCTYSENNKHAFRTGLKNPTKPIIGEASNLSSHTEDEVRMVCELFERVMIQKVSMLSSEYQKDLPQKYIIEKLGDIYQKIIILTRLFYIINFLIEILPKLYSIYIGCVCVQKILWNI